MHVDELLQLLLEVDGTDLYLTAGAPPRLSVGHTLRDALPRALESAEVRALIEPLIVDKAAFQRRPELDLARRVGEKGRFRLNVYKQRGELALVARRIRVDIKTLDDLAMPSVLKDLSLARMGLVLVTGSTGSGKSTTLAAMIDARNRGRAGHIVTIEDPIEFLHEHRMSIVSQREVGVDTASFEDALKSALRQAPDVLLVGEIRDRETAEAALSFAETGHLVFATVHSNNAPQTVERLLGLFPSDRHVQIQMMLSANVRGIVSQRLIPTVDAGRAVALEVLLPTARIRDLLKRGERDQLRNAIAEGGREGMRTFDQSLLVLYQAGRVTLDTALAFADNATDLRLATSLTAAGKAGEAPDESGIRLVRSEPAASRRGS
jgi:twitching motility protein PilU